MCILKNFNVKRNTHQQLVWQELAIAMEYVLDLTNNDSWAMMEMAKNSHGTKMYQIKREKNHQTQLQRVNMKIEQDRPWKHWQLRRWKWMEMVKNGNNDDHIDGNRNLK